MNLQSCLLPRVDSDVTTGDFGLDLHGRPWFRMFIPFPTHPTSKAVTINPLRTRGPGCVGVRARQRETDRPLLGVTFHLGKQHRLASSPSTKGRQKDIGKSNPRSPASLSPAVHQALLLAYWAWQ